MNSPTSLSRSMDYLGDLGAKLRDLQGYATLASELIQNADDASATWMAFDVRPRALVIDNDGVFSDCGEMDTVQCPWSHDGIHNYRCDFHRLRVIGSGDKRLQAGTTGAFGIGFIAVYQLTDQPELISAGRHWILHEERSEVDRIEVCSGCTDCEAPGLPGTRIILPYARDEQSQLRKELRAAPVPDDVTARLLGELEHSLQVAVLFLKNLQAIEIRERGVCRRKYERANVGDTLIVSEGASGSDRVWHLIRGTFQDEAAALRRQHPGRIEDKRTVEVVVALPAEGGMSAGMLCACLPTQEVPGLPFHINADFFPSNDRKHILLGDDYQAHWNREALSAAAKAVAEATPRLTQLLGAGRFWGLVSSLYQLFNTHKDSDNGVWARFWDALDTALRKDAVVPTSSGEWVTASSGVSLLQQSEEASNIHVLEGLGITLVSECLRPYQTILRTVGVHSFDIANLCSALRLKGLDKSVGFEDLPACLTSSSGREALWNEIDILLRRRASTTAAKSRDETLLRTISLAPTIDRSLSPCRSVYSAEATTVQLFEPLGLPIHFLDESETAFSSLKYLCTPFDAEEAVQTLEDSGSQAIQRLWDGGLLDLPRLIEWFANRREDIVHDQDLCQRLASVSIYPSRGELCPLSHLALPGNFRDPLGLASLVDENAIGGRREFLLDLGVEELDFRTYVTGHLAQALDDSALDTSIRRAAVALLADGYSALIDDAEARRVLSSVRLVRCRDGEYRRASDCYFPSSNVQDLLEEDANIAVLPDDREAAVEQLFDWLGLDRRPRLADLLSAVRKTAAMPHSPHALIRVRKIVDHLSGRLKELNRASDLSALTLRFIKWLPARGDSSGWHQPSSLFAPYQSYLCESQVGVLDVAQNVNRDFLEFLGVSITPSPELVVRHLQHSVDRKEEVNREVYRFLNERADHPAIEHLKATECLFLGHEYQSPNDVFWGEHPFGRYRWRLSEELRAYGRLLARIGVKDTPSHEDALAVLHEISLEFGHGPLNDEAYAVLMNCWQTLNKALEDGATSEEQLADLGRTKCIPNKENVLYYPTLLFFENRAGLAAKFGEFLDHNVIPRQLGTAQAFMASGVRQLGSAVELELLRNEEPAADPDTKERFFQRRTEIARVLTGHMDSLNARQALSRLNDLNCHSAKSLELRYSLDTFQHVVKSEPEPVPALYQSEQHLLWTTRPNGELPWAPLARELAIALCPEEDPGIFAAGLKEVLVANTADDAETALDELGFPQLDTDVIEAPPSQESAHQLGIEFDVDEHELQAYGTQDAGHSGVFSPEDTQQSSPADALAHLGISGTPSPPVPETEEPVGSFGKVGVSQNGSQNNMEGRPNSSGRARTFVSYVAVNPNDDEGPDPDGLTYSERIDLEDKSIELILTEEPKLKRTPTNNPGFDLTESGPDEQPTKWIEVKAMAGTLRDRSVGLSRTQFEYAQEHGKAYWLYVVENAGDAQQARIIRIQDPAGKARTFTFDRGWIAVSENPSDIIPVIHDTAQG